MNSILLDPNPIRTSMESKPAKPAAFRFEFRKQYDEIYTNKESQFVLRQEHLAELKRLMEEHNKNRRYAQPISMSDILNGALDFVFEHSLSFKFVPTEGEIKNVIAKEVYRKAFFRFMQYNEIF